MVKDQRRKTGLRVLWRAYRGDHQNKNINLTRYRKKKSENERRHTTQRKTLK